MNKPPLLQQGPLIEWDIDKIAQGLGVRPLELRAMLVADGNFMNPVISMFLGAHGFGQIRDRFTGKLLTLNGAFYRLRVFASQSMEISKEWRKGSKRVHPDTSAGWIVVFAQETPRLTSWIISQEFLSFMVERHAINAKGRGRTETVREFLYHIWSEQQQRNET